MVGDDANRDNHNLSSLSPTKRYPEKQEVSQLWGIFLFGLIGAAATTYAAGQFRSSVNWFFFQMSGSQSGKTGRSFRSAFQEEARRKYNHRMQEEYEEEMERVERIRRMQSVFNRDRSKHKRAYESWGGNSADPGPGHGQYHQHFQRDDWYWKTDASYQNQRTNYRETPRASASSPLSHHYSVLGLDRSRKTPYTEAEIKTAFRTKAKQFHPDQNQNNKEAAEVKFKEVMTSYEAIKQERKDNKF